MSTEIFRKVALERLSTPDQLDQALLLTPSGVRIALYFGAAVVAVIVAAGFFISVPIMAGGVGIVLGMEGVGEVAAVSGGRVLAVLVRDGDTVLPGQALLRLDQPDLRQALETAQAELRDLQGQRERIAAIQQRDHQVQARQRSQQRGELQIRLGSARARLAWLQQRLAQDRALVDSGYLNQARFKDTEAELLQMRDAIAQLDSQIKILDSDSAAASHGREREIIDLDVRIAGLRHRSDELAQKLARDSIVTSTARGAVTETKVAAGDMLASGQPVLTLLPAAPDGHPVTAPPLHVIAFLPSGEAKKVRVGMAVRVTPDNVKKAEFGSIVGTVLSVGNIPATSEGMQRILRNRQLVQTLSQQSAPIEVRLALRADAASPSGLRWTSRGPAHGLEAGTTVEAEVVVKRMRLLVLALPALERWLHLEPAA